jgi:hypothetical protein
MNITSSNHDVKDNEVMQTCCPLMLRWTDGKQPLYASAGQRAHDDITCKIAKNASSQLSEDGLD